MFTVDSSNVWPRVIILNSTTSFGDFTSSFSIVSWFKTISYSLIISNGDTTTNPIPSSSVELNSFKESLSSISKSSYSFKFSKPNIPFF